MHENYSNKQMPQNISISAKHALKPEKSSTEFTNQSWFILESRGRMAPAECEKCDQKLIRHGEFHNELTHQVYNEIGQWFVYKCAERARPFRATNVWIIQGSEPKS